MSSDNLIHEASNPATAPARLAELASADRATWPALAANPMTYDGLLQWLAERNEPAVNAALAARTQAALPPVPPPAAPVPPAAPAASVEPTQAPAEAPDETPTVVTPAEPAFTAPVEAQPAVASEPTAVFAAPLTEPTTVFQTPGAPEPTATYVPVAAATAAPGGPVDGNGANGNKNLTIVIAMVAVVLALIAGAAYGATQVFGDDDDTSTSSPADTKKSSPAPSDDYEDEDSTLPSDDLSDDDLPGASAEFCSTMKRVEDASRDMIGNSGTTPDLDAITEMGQDMAAAYDDLANSAPSELQSDIEIMGSYFDLMTDPTADSASKMGDSISEYMDAAQKVGVYYATNCL